jgi:hypothetical protein
MHQSERVSHRIELQQRNRKMMSYRRSSSHIGQAKLRLLATLQRALSVEICTDSPDAVNPVTSPAQLASVDEISFHRWIPSFHTNGDWESGAS